MKAKWEALALALEGSVGDHQRFMLGLLLDRVESLDREIEELSQEIERRLRPCQAEIALLDEVPGIGIRVAESIVAEVGTDMSRFPSAKHLCSWAKVCPGNNQSGGKRRSGKTGKGNSWLRETLIEAAHAAIRTKDSYYGARFRRLAKRRGGERAVVAVAHAMLTAIYYILRDGVHHRDLGADHFERMAPKVSAARAVRQLEKLGYHVTLEPVAA